METLTPIFNLFFQILLISSAPFLYLKYGALLLKLISKIRTSDNEFPLAILFFPGLVLFLVLTFLLKIIGLPWIYTSLITIFPLLIRRDINQDIFNALRTYKFTWNFALWLCVITALGISLVDSTSSIQTPWINAYGDLAFHTGMITSFALGENFPPQNHIYAGITLTYPFFVNLWSASLWWPDPNFASYQLTLLAQWLLVWVPLYHVLHGDKLKVLPWAILMGGGSLLTLGTHSGENIKGDYPWSVFLTTIWIPQRAAMLGVLGAMTALRCFHDFLKTPSKFNSLILCALTLSLMPLVHTHFFLVVSLYIGLVLLFSVTELSLKPLLTFSVWMIPSLLFLPWLIGKESIFSLHAAWRSWNDNGKLLDVIWGAVEMWAHNAHLWFLILILIWILSRSHKNILAILILFILGNIFHFAVWEWDQIKIFVGLYIITLSLWSFYGEQKWVIRSHYLLVITLLPAIFEISLVMREFKMHTIYSFEDTKIQGEIVAHTPSDAIVLAAPRHNSPVTLSGRKLYLGYPGTLHSHGHKYQDRQQRASSLFNALTCSNDGRNQELPCPNYLLWTNHEVKLWGALTPDVLSHLEPTASPRIFKIMGTVPF